MSTPFSDFLGGDEASALIGVEIEVITVMRTRSQSEEGILVVRPLHERAETVSDEGEGVHH